MILNKILEILKNNPKGLDKYEYFIDNNYLTLRVYHSYNYNVNSFLDIDNIVFIIKGSNKLEIIYNIKEYLK